jgi:hypothetical protein
MPNKKPTSAQVYSFDRHASRQGIAPDTLMVRLKEKRWKPRTSDDDCLEPEEVQEYCTAKSLPSERYEHLMSCPDCRGLVAASLPTKDSLEAFADEVERIVKRSIVYR